MPHTTTRDWVRRGASLAAGLLFGLGFALVCLGSAWAASPLRPTASVSATGQIWHVNNAFDDGLVGYWKFDQLSGTATINSAPLGFLTTVSNGASVSASPPPAPHRLPHPGARL